MDGQVRTGKPKTGHGILSGLMRHKTDGNICDEHYKLRNPMGVYL